ncbi:CRISPR-associated helicase Cas3' [Azotobacter chroococcum]
MLRMSSWSWFFMAASVAGRETGCGAPGGARFTARILAHSHGEAGRRLYCDQDRTPRSGRSVALSKEDSGIVPLSLVGVISSAGSRDRLPALRQEVRHDRPIFPTHPGGPPALGQERRGVGPWPARPSAGRGGGGRGAAGARAARDARALRPSVRPARAGLRAACRRAGRPARLRQGHSRFSGQMARGPAGRRGPGAAVPAAFAERGRACQRQCGPALGAPVGPGYPAPAVDPPCAAGDQRPSRLPLQPAGIQPRQAPFEPAAWAEARREIFAAYWAVLAPQGIPQVEALSLPAVQWLAGLTSVADWIGSNPDWFPQGEREDSLAGHHADACRRAEQALAAIGWSRSAVLLHEAAGVDQLIGRIVQRPASSARPLQREADRLLDGVRGPALLLVEAPMGEGKTELAFLAHLRLQAANRHRGLYVALPTQATGNALFRRALTFLRAFAGDAALDMQLVHGGAALSDDVRQLHDIHGVPGESVTASAWFSQRRRPLLSPYGVGTVDQALFAALNVKHHFVRLWGLANRVVVLDEVHAYDSYTGGLIEALLRWLKALGSSVVLMSATLPAQRRAALLRAWGVADEDAPAPAYPRLLLADERGLLGATCESRPLPSIRLQAVGTELDSLADCALECLQGGGCGALIVNTVDRAQALYLGLRERLGDSARLLLFHARFPADQRGEREREVLAAFGADGERPAGALLIATQVAEQSLDIDFDFMLSDLAPVDLLLQRAGRLHRHRRTRPAAHAEARLFVAGLAPERLPDLKGTGWEYVYDSYILGRTWALLSREAELQLPQDIDRLVQAVYGETGLPADLTEVDRALIEDEAYGSHLGKRQTEQMMALNVAIDPDAEPQAAYVQKCRGYEEGEEGLGLPNYTRLGEESVSLVPLHVVAGAGA